MISGSAMAASLAGLAVYLHLKTTWSMADEEDGAGISLIEHLGW